MKSFLPPNRVKGAMCLLHLQKATMHTVKRLWQPHLGAANNQVFTVKPFLHRCQEPRVAPCKQKAQRGVCYMCDEPIPRKRDTIALKSVRWRRVFRTIIVR